MLWSSGLYVLWVNMGSHSKLGGENLALGVAFVPAWSICTSSEMKQERGKGAWGLCRGETERVGGCLWAGGIHGLMADGMSFV